MKLEDAGAQAITEMVRWVKASSDVMGKAGGKAVDWASGQIPDLIKK